MKPPSSSATPPPDPSAIEEAALGWLTERDDGFTPAREREFARWLRADPRHAAALARLEQTLDLLGELPAYRADINTAFQRGSPVVPFPSAPVRPAVRRGWRRVAVAGAAAVLLLGAVATWQVLWPANETRYTTTVAGYERARLDDGSTVELNAATAVRVQFTKAERRVELDVGEAHFAVAHDAARPFIVSAGSVAVRAVGTAFNVRHAADGAVEVIVTEGKVRVGQTGSESSGAASAPLVAAGERLVLPRQAPMAVVEKVTPSALRAALAGRAGLRSSPRRRWPMSWPGSTRVAGSSSSWRIPRSPTGGSGGPSRSTRPRPSYDSSSATARSSASAGKAMRSTSAEPARRWPSPIATWRCRRLSAGRGPDYFRWDQVLWPSAALQGWSCSCACCHPTSPSPLPPYAAASWPE